MSLSPKEQQALFNSCDILHDYYDTIDKRDMMSKEEEDECIKLYVESGKTNLQLRDKIFLANTLYVISLAKKYSIYGFPLIDLIQEGNIGLLEAIERYEPDKVANMGRVINFATSRILLHIKRYIKGNLKMTSFSRTNDREKLFYALPKYITSSDVKMTDTLAETISNEMGISIPIIKEMYNYLRPTSHISTTLVRSDDDGVLDFFDINDVEGEDIEHKIQDEIVSSHVKRCVNIAISCLTDVEMAVVSKRLLYDEEEGQPTLSEVGEALGGKSREWVRLVQNRAIKKMKEELVNNGVQLASLFE